MPTRFVRDVRLGGGSKRKGGKAEANSGGDAMYTFSAARPENNGKAD